MMLPSRQRISRLFIADPNLMSLGGHYITYAASVAAAARLIEVECILLGHLGIDPDLAATFGVVPTYRGDIWRNATGGPYYADDNQEIINREFFEDSDEALQRYRLTTGDAIFYPTITAGQIDGIASLVESASSRDVQHSILLRYSGNYYSGAVAARGFRRLEGLAKTRDVRIVSDSHRLDYELGAYTSLPIGVLPIPHTFDAGEATELGQDRVLHLVSLGNARGEKGLDEIFQAIRASAGQSWGKRLRFTIQVNDPSSDIVARVSDFVADQDSRVTLVTQALNLEDYAAVLRSADAVLLPYHRDVYAARTSGVFLEGSAAGKIALVTADTWMSDMVEHYDNGVLVADRSGPNLARSIQHVVENHASLATKALSAATRIRAFHNPKSFVDKLLGETTISDELPARRRAVIFYPWGDIDSRSVAATRATLLAKYLAEYGRDVRIMYFGNIDQKLAPEINMESYDAEHWQSGQLSDSIRNYVEDSAGAKIECYIHLCYHMYPSSDEQFKRRCLRLVRWADEVFVEYTYFAGVIGAMAASTGKPAFINAHSLASEMARDVEPIFSMTRALEAAALRHSDDIFVSDELQKGLFAGEGIATKIIPYPVDIEAIPDLESEDAEFILSDILKLPIEGRRLCVFIGSDQSPDIAAAQNVRALASIAASDPRLQHVMFVVAGSAHDIETGQNFVALGQIEALASEALYKVAAIIVLPFENGTGIVVPAVEALARGACIISTRAGVDGHPVVSGQHCLIEDDFTLYPDHLVQLLEAPDRVAGLKRLAKELGLQYDYRRLFAAYDLSPGSGAPLKVTCKPLSFDEFLPRIARGDLTAAGLDWLLGRLDVVTMTCDQLANTARTCERLMRENALVQNLRLALIKVQPETVSEVLTKWEFLYDKCDVPHMFVTDLEPLLREPSYRLLREPGYIGVSKCCEYFPTGEEVFLSWMCEVMTPETQALSNPGMAYVFAMLNARLRRPTADVVGLLNLAMDKGFPPTWVLMNRGHLRVSSGDLAGREDLKQVIDMGGDAATQVEAILLPSYLDGARASFNSERYATAVEFTALLLKEGKQDPDFHFLCAMSRHRAGLFLTEAEEHYVLALQGGVDPSAVLFELGRLRLSLKNPKGRIDLERVVELGGDHAVAAKSLLAEVRAEEATGLIVEDHPETARGLLPETSSGRVNLILSFLKRFRR